MAYLFSGGALYGGGVGVLQHQFICSKNTGLSINGEDVDNCFDIAETYEHNIVITGHSKSMSQYDKEEKFIHESPMATYYSHFDQNDYDYWVTTLNASGELIWQNLCV